MEKKRLNRYTLDIVLSVLHYLLRLHIFGLCFVLWLNDSFHMSICLHCKQQ